MIYQKMMFIKFEESKVFFRSDLGIEIKFNLLESKVGDFTEEIYIKVSKMKKGEVYTLEVTEDLLVGVVRKNEKQENLEKEKLRKKYLTYKMKRGNLTDIEFQEASILGIKEQRVDYSWVFIGIFSSFLYLTLQLLVSFF